jgi:hypothetical protein
MKTVARAGFVPSNTPRQAIRKLILNLRINPCIPAGPPSLTEGLSQARGGEKRFPVAEKKRGARHNA